MTAPTVAPPAYTRRIRIDGLTVTELQTGDQVDISEDAEPDWATVISVGEHTSYSPHCDGTCAAVIVFGGLIGAVPWHVAEDDEVYARFAAVAR